MLDYSADFTLSSDNLFYINQFTADKDGNLPETIFPKYFSEASTVLVIGDFGNGIEVRTSSGAVTGVKIPDITLNYKSQTKLEASISSTDSRDVNYTCTYSSSDTSVATVDENGNVTATGRGEAEITVTAIDEYGNIVEDTCKVTVTFAWWQWIIYIVFFGWIWY